MRSAAPLPEATGSELAAASTSALKAASTQKWKKLVTEIFDKTLGIAAACSTAFTGTTDLVNLKSAPDLTRHDVKQVFSVLRGVLPSSEPRTPLDAAGASNNVYQDLLKRRKFQQDALQNAEKVRRGSAGEPIPPGK